MGETAERILSAALNRFAKDGYKAASMRQIAQDVGIRAASIYNHFPNKQSIFDALLERARSRMERRKQAFGAALEQIDRVDRQAFEEEGVRYLRDYLCGAEMLPLIHLLERERGTDEKARRLWRELMIDEPLRYQTAVFERLMARGMMPRSDAALLAAAYQSAVLLAFFSGDESMLRRQLNDLYDRAF